MHYPIQMNGSQLPVHCKKSGEGAPMVPYLIAQRAVIGF
jgi:hypothetical protein